MKEFYTDTKFKTASLALIEVIERVMREYIVAGYKLTVRQLYYQLVSRDIIPNTEKSYKNTVNLVNNARLAGLLDWDVIEDRTRGFIERSRWSSGASIIRSAANGFHMDMWDNQDKRVFVIIEKEALVGVLESICHKYDVPLLAARGYPSASVLREFAKYDLNGNGKENVILHLGDHDPSGIDMTRDLIDRLNLFTGGRSEFRLHRIALTMDQIDDQQPPPNPAKTTDARFIGYRNLYGNESWELDALQPSYMNDLVEAYIEDEIDLDAWDERTAEIDSIKGRLNKVAHEFEDAE